MYEHCNNIINPNGLQLIIIRCLKNILSLSLIRTALNIAKCQPGNDVCIGETVTKIIRHRVGKLIFSNVLIVN